MPDPSTAKAERAPVARAEPAEPSPTPPPPRTLESGLVIEDLVLGEGPECPPGAVASVRFSARFKDGTEYDSSERRRRPLDLPLAGPGLIQGLRQGVPGMRAGGKRRLFIPWRLAYGQSGRDPVPAKMDLVFEIELLGFK